MPELPEVEILRRYFEEVALNKEIIKVEFYDKLDKIFKTPRSIIADSLVGNSFNDTHRIGKYLFAKISSGKWLHLHFGMTGTLEIFSHTAPLPKYTRFAIEFKDGDKLAFRDLRKFGVIQIINTLEEFRKESGLGTDLLKIEKQDFIQSLSNRKTAVKNALLDQKDFAGIGNWIADEMLFETGVHPEAIANALTRDQVGELYESAVRIVKEAIAFDTHYGSFPEHFFTNYRKEGAIHPDHKNSPVERLVVGGRGTFIVPEKQKKPV